MASTPQTGGSLTYDIGGDNQGVNGGRRLGRIVERVTGVGSSGYLQLTKQLPANSRIVYATLNNRNTITPRIASSAAQTTAGQLGIALISGTALPSMAGALNTTSNIILGQIQTAAAASVAANSIARGLAPVAATGGGRAATSWIYPNATVAHNLYVIPFLSTTAATATGSFYVDTTATTGTSQYTLNGTGTATSGTTTADFDVQVFFEEFLDTPNA